MYSYPLKLSYKFLTIGNKIKVTDANGNQVFFIEMKNFKLKEDIRVYSSDAKEKELFTIAADRIIDFSAKYSFTKNGTKTGAIKRRGLKSLWSAHYDVFDHSDTITHMIEEANPWIVVANTLLELVPFASLFSGFIFHPCYNLYHVDKDKNQPMMQLKKHASFIEASFSIEKLEVIDSNEVEERMLQSLMTVVLLEKMRG